MGAQVSDADYPDFAENDFLRVFLQMFRNSLGDIDVIDAGRWNSKDPIEEDDLEPPTFD